MSSNNPGFSSFPNRAAESDGQVPSRVMTPAINIVQPNHLSTGETFGEIVRYLPRVTFDPPPTEDEGIATCTAASDSPCNPQKKGEELDWLPGKLSADALPPLSAELPKGDGCRQSGCGYFREPRPELPFPSQPGKSTCGTRSAKGIACT